MNKLTLSFDNGPDPVVTPQVLDVLAERGIKATFFVCGQGNSMHPARKAGSDAGRAVLERALKEGHLVGNHSLSHTVAFGTTYDPKVPAREIGKNEDIMGAYNEQKLFRPFMSGGISDERVFSPESIEYLCEHEYTVVLFNCLPRDWEHPDDWPEKAFEIAKNQDWSLLIIHDVEEYRSTKELARFLDQAIADGVEIVQEFPPDCLPIVKGELVGDLTALTCGDPRPEPAKIPKLDGARSPQ
jgi:peptidoglycan/xylan/chitin deacetylase (PgdA/CDA1 family)